MSQYSPTTQSPTDGMAMNWVLDHVITHPETYQTALPLRTIYSLNCRTAGTTPASFEAMLLEHLQNQPVQPCTLPPAFLTSFVDNCFPAALDRVDFNQALTALDYLRDLELRRQQDLAKAVRARGLADPKIAQLSARSVKLDHLYAKALVGVRRWTLMHELSLSKFNKCNCVALLNTLYPLEEASINAHLTASVLSQQRKALWKYIVGVERHGAQILDGVRDARGTTNTDWANIAGAVHAYARAALDMIRTAEDVARPASFGSYGSSFLSDNDDDAELEPTSPKHALGRRRSSAGLAGGGNESSEGELVGGGVRRSRLEKIVRGLAKLSKRGDTSHSHSHSHSHSNSGSNSNSNSNGNGNSIRRDNWNRSYYDLGSW